MRTPCGAGWGRSPRWWCSRPWRSSCITSWRTCTSRACSRTCTRSRAARWWPRSASPPSATGCFQHLRGAGARLPAAPGALHPHRVHLVHRLLLRAYPRIRRLHRRRHPLPPVRDRGPHRHRCGDRLGLLQPVARHRPGDHARGCRCCSRRGTRRAVLHLHHHLPVLVGTLLLAAVGAYALWACLARGRLEIRGWALRAPGPAIGLAQIALSVPTCRCPARCCGRCCRRARTSPSSLSSACMRRR